MPCPHDSAPRDCTACLEARKLREDIRAARAYRRSLERRADYDSALIALVTREAAAQERQADALEALVLLAASFAHDAAGGLTTDEIAAVEKIRARVKGAGNG